MATTKNSSTPKTTKPHKSHNPRGYHYNDDTINYERYWDSRTYEHLAEVSVIKNMLSGMHVRDAVDIGGGYGRLSVILDQFANNTILLESSQQQLDIARDFLNEYSHITLTKNITPTLDLGDASMDIALMVRVMHQYSEPKEVLKEVYRILKPGGVFVLEFANQTHLKNRILSILSGRSLSFEPVSVSTQDDNAIPFVNHHPKTVLELVESIGFSVESKQSVSLFRSKVIKSIFAPELLSVADQIARPFVSAFDCGPSVFLKLRK